MGIPENDAEEAQAARDRDLPPAAEADQRRATEAAAAEAAAEYEEVVEAVRDGAEIHVEAGSMEEGEEVDGEVAGPDPELAGPVDEFLGANAELVVSDPQDRHEGMIAMDAHDVELLMRDITEQAQGAALRKWVYKLPSQGKPEGLSVHGVQDIVQRMNWTGKCAIKALPETLAIRMEQVDGENGPEPYIVATIFAEDAKTGSVLPGVSSEPRMMQLKESTAKAKREEGKQIRPDGKVFDRFAETKAVQKATRNAIGAFIPEEVEQAVLAMAFGDARRVERIQTKAEAEAAQLPPALGTPEALALEERCSAIYAEVRELGNGKGKLALPPGRFNGLMASSRHSIPALEAALGWLEERKTAIALKLEQEEAGAQ